MSLPYGPPQHVSSLIRGARVILFVAGVVYARGKVALYTSQENAYREEQAIKQIARKRRAEERRTRIAAEEKQMVLDLESGKLFEARPC